MRKQSLKSAIPRMIAASLCFAIMGVFVKASVASLPFLVAVFFRSFVGFVALLAWFLATRKPVTAVQHGLLLLRSLFGFLALMMFFFALENLPLSTATVLNFSSPIFVVLLSGVFLKERRVATVLPLVLVAFVGAALLVAPDLSTVNFAAVLGLMSALFAAMAYITVNRLARTESSATIVLYFSLYSSAFSFVVLTVATLTGLADLSLFRVAHVLSDPKELGFLVGVGAFATLGQVFLTSAYARARASIISAFSFLSPVFSYLFGLCLFDEVPTVSGVIGGAVVIAASVGVVLLAAGTGGGHGGGGESPGKPLPGDSPCEPSI